MNPKTPGPPTDALYNPLPKCEYGDQVMFYNKSEGILHKGPQSPGFELIDRRSLGGGTHLIRWALKRGHTPPE